VENERWIVIQTNKLDLLSTRRFSVGFSFDVIIHEHTESISTAAQRTSSTRHAPHLHIGFQHAKLNRMSANGNTQITRMKVKRGSGTVVLQQYAQQSAYRCFFKCVNKVIG
jgi:hypothetical protein